VHVGLRGSVNICHKLLSLESSPAQGACVFQTGIIQIGDDRDKGLHHTHTHTHTHSHTHTRTHAHTHILAHRWWWPSVTPTSSLPASCGLSSQPGMCSEPVRFKLVWPDHVVRPKHRPVLLYNAYACATTHQHTHTHTDSYIDPCISITLPHMKPPTNTHTYRHRHTDTHTCTNFSEPVTRRHTNKYTHARLSGPRHTHIHTHKHTHTHTLTHTHTSLSGPRQGGGAPSPLHV